jgi:hypothetical protein
MMVHGLMAVDTYSAKAAPVTTRLAEVYCCWAYECQTCDTVIFVYGVFDFTVLPKATT